MRLKNQALQQLTHGKQIGVQIELQIEVQDVCN